MLPEDPNAEIIGLVIMLFIVYAVSAFLIWKMSK